MVDVEMDGGVGVEMVMARKGGSRCGKGGRTDSGRTEGKGFGG